MPIAHDPSEEYKPRTELPFLRFDEVTITTSRRYLIHKLFPKARLIVVWGPPKCGKSYFVFDAMMAVALGRDYHGLRVEQGPVVYVACEGEEGFKDRIEAYRQAHLDGHDGEVPFYLVPSRLDLVNDNQTLINGIKAKLGDQSPVAVVLDTLNRSMFGSENSPEDMTAYVRATDAVREAFGCACIVIHHCGHDGSHARGHTALLGALDAEIEVRKDNSTGVFTATVNRMKDGQSGHVIAGRLKAIEIAKDEDGEPITACVVVEEDVPAEHAGKRLSGQALIAYRQLEKAIAEAGETPPASDHIPKNVKAVPLTLWRRYCYQGGITSVDTKDAKKKAFPRAVTRLQEIGLIGLWDNHVWIAK